MQTEYMPYVKSALNDGMTPEEVQKLFSYILQKSDTKQGKKVLGLFARGIGGAKAKTLNNTKTVRQTFQPKVYELFKQ